MMTFVCVCVRHARGQIDISRRALCCLANALYFSESNRRRLADLHDGVRRVAAACGSGDTEVAEHALRALGSAAASDHVAAQLHAADMIGIPIEQCRSAHPAVARYAAFVLTNLATNELCKVRMIELGAVEALISIEASPVPEIVKQASDALNVLTGAAFTEPPEVVRARFDPAHIIEALNGPSEEGRFTAVETITDMAASGVEGQEDLGDINAVSECAAIVKRVAVHSDVDGNTVFMFSPQCAREFFVKIMWALRALTYDCPINKHRLVACDVMELVLQARGGGARRGTAGEWGAVCWRARACAQGCGLGVLAHSLTLCVCLRARAPAGLRPERPRCPGGGPGAAGRVHQRRRGDEPPRAAPRDSVGGAHFTRRGGPWQWRDGGGLAVAAHAGQSGVNAEEPPGPGLAQRAACGGGGPHAHVAGENAPATGGGAAANISVGAAVLGVR
jgi:hypothetical protein